MTATTLATRQVLIASFTAGAEFIDQVVGGGPILLTLSGDVRKPLSGTTAKIYFSLDEFVGGVWQPKPTAVSSPNIQVIIVPAYTTLDFRFTMRTNFDGGIVATQLLRLSAYVEPNAPFSSAQVAVDSVLMTIEQLNR